MEQDTTAKADYKSFKVIPRVKSKPESLKQKIPI